MSNFSNNKKPEPCIKCWKNEELDIKSKRQFSNEFLDYKLNTDLAKLEFNAHDNKSNIVMYQISASNLCNGACVTCNSTGSTAWAKYEEKMGVKSNKLMKSSIIDINYQTAKSIIFTGGEPLFDPLVFNILSNLIEVNNTDCFISFVTNGSVSLSNKHEEILNKFSAINFCISIDGTGRVFEYLRFPLKWNKLLENLSYFRTITNNISVSYTISNISAIYKDDTITWFKDQNLPYAINKVYYPHHFSPDVLPGHELWSKFVQTIKMQDKAKGIDIKDYLPDMYKLLTQGIIDVQSI
jgi:sulfatase maturation enzyme AslB (radical SAM superfamily)